MKEQNKLHFFFCTFSSEFSAVEHWLSPGCPETTARTQDFLTIHTLMDTWGKKSSGGGSSSNKGKFLQ